MIQTFSGNGRTLSKVNLITEKTGSKLTCPVQAAPEMLLCVKTL